MTKEELATVQWDFYPKFHSISKIYFFDFLPFFKFTFLTANSDNF